MYKLRVRLRDYQEEALAWSLSKPGAVVVMPTGSGKTVIAAGWVAVRLSRGDCRKVLILEPTRILVAQVSGVISRVVEGVESCSATGRLDKRERVAVYNRCRVVVATPEAALNDLEEIRAAGFDCIVVDECHHAVGRDATVGVLEGHSWRYRLGLTAFLPREREWLAERLIGEVRRWSWSDPRIAPYVPPWIGEVYETPLNEAEMRIFKALEEMASRLAGPDRLVVRLAQRWLVRDGVIALWDSLSRETRLAELLESVKGLLYAPGVRPAHKLEHLLRALEDHGNPKTIVFIDRVVVAQYVASVLSKRGYRTVLIAGRMRVNVEEALREARRPETRVIVSTSAGEEGLDLPEAEMLVIWSNVASPLRFIQRHGRVRRAVGRGGPPRIVVYLVTPDTPDMDSFVEGLEYALEAGVDVPVDPALLDVLRRRTVEARVLSVLREHPMPPEWVASVTGLALDRVERALRRLCKRGDVLYIHTPYGRVYAARDTIPLLYEKLGEYLAGDARLEDATIVYTLVDGRKGRVDADDWREAFKKLSRVLGHANIQRLHFSTFYPLPTGPLVLINLRYTCLIDDTAKLEAVLRNAFSTKLLEYRGRELARLPGAGDTLEAGEGGEGIRHDTTQEASGAPGGKDSRE